MLCPHAVPYRATDLGVLPSGKYSTATDINSAGQVVGIGEVPIVALGATQPFLWQNGVMIALTPAPLGNYDYVGGAAAINPAGQAVGEIRHTYGRPHSPWLWDQGVMNFFANREGHASDINPEGQVVGAVIHIPEFNHNDAFLWDNGTMTELGSLAAGAGTEAYGIDPAGRVVGRSDGRAFLWENGVMADLNIPGGESIARRINAAGQVVGEVMVDGVTHGFIWHNGVTTDLGEVAQVNDINAGGQAVGWRIVEGTDHAFVWENGTFTDLPGPSRAFGINDEGQIVGDAGLGPPDNGLTRPSRATLWTPE